MEALFEQFLAFDRTVFEWVELHLWGALGGALDQIMTIITYLGEDGAIWAVLGLLLLFFKKTRKVGFAVLASLAVTGVINNLVLKQIFDRPRPFNLEQWADWFQYPNFVAKPSSSSFPSGHASSSIACAVGTMVSGKKRLWIPALIVAVLIAFSRIYVHVHYPSDVIGGAIVGIIYGLLGILCTWLLFEKIIPKWKERHHA